MATDKVFNSFGELAEYVRFEQTKNKGREKPHKLPPTQKASAPPKKDKVKGRVNSRARSR